jgi:pimeloyl-ACP methyl ester carboxylesterase
MDSGSISRIEVAVEGVQTSVLTAGSPSEETAVVFVHGSSGQGSDWQALMRGVSSFARCLAPDMPGYGESDKPSGFAYTVDGYARHLGILLDSLAVRRVHLVTHDLGGVWGLAWAVSRPTSLRSITLMSIGVLPGYRWHRFAQLYRVPLLGELVLAAANRSAIRRVLQAGSRRPIPSWFVDEIAKAYRHEDTRRAVLAFYRRTRDLGSVTVRAAAALHDVDLPALVVWGAGDPYVPVRYAAVQREFFPQAEVVIVPGSGHWPFIDAAEPVMEAVVGFLRRQLADAD